MKRLETTKQNIACSSELHQHLQLLQILFAAFAFGRNSETLLVFFFGHRFGAGYGWLGPLDFPAESTMGASKPLEPSGCQLTRGNLIPNILLRKKTNLLPRKHQGKSAEWNTIANGLFLRTTC